MSTNFYAREKCGHRVHVGKRVGTGHGRTLFIWARHPDALEGVEIVEDEYGTMYSRHGFTEIVLGSSDHRFDSIGLAFS